MRKEDFVQTYYRHLAGLDMWSAVVIHTPHRELCHPMASIGRSTRGTQAQLRMSIWFWRVPALNGALLKSLVCLYENSPNGHFIIDRGL